MRERSLDLGSWILDLWSLVFSTEGAFEGGQVLAPKARLKVARVLAPKARLRVARGKCERSEHAAPGINGAVC